LAKPQHLPVTKPQFQGFVPLGITKPQLTKPQTLLLLLLKSKCLLLLKPQCLFLFKPHTLHLLLI
jgi:hypothetical protein